MKKVLKITGIVLLIIIILTIALPFIFKNQILQKVKQEINNNLNAKVDFKDYGLSLLRSFPDFSLELDGLTIVGIDEFAQDTLANIEQIYVSIDLFSVFKGDNYKIKTIKLEKPNLLLKVLKGGKANWDIYKTEEVTVTDADTIIPVPTADTTKKHSLFKLYLHKLTINNANIIYYDEDLNFKTSIKNLNHTLKGDFTADFTSLITKTDIASIDLSYEAIKYLNKGSSLSFIGVSPEIGSLKIISPKTFNFGFKPEVIPNPYKICSLIVFCS